MIRLFGPPGTGKTTALLTLMGEAISTGILPGDMAFLAFSKKASGEARERAAKQFSLDPRKDLPYFRTLHSLALSCTTIQKEQVMQNEHYQELGRAIGVTFENISPLQYEYEENGLNVPTSNDPVLRLINKARLKKTILRVEYNHAGLNIPWDKVLYIAKSLMEYKRTHLLFDFTDMLGMFVKDADALCPKLEITFLDEAQDLSPLQWDIAYALDRSSKMMYCAGDDDQAIFRWAGADFLPFINHKEESRVLSQSYRVPQKVHALAQKVAARISTRFPKEYNPTPELGKVSYLPNMNSLDMAHGSWLILAQAGYLLTSVPHILRAFGYLFIYRGQRSIPEILSQIIQGWQNLRAGGEISGDLARSIYLYMAVGSRIKRGFKKLTSLMDEDLATLSYLISNCGLLEATREMEWDQALNKIPENQIGYIKSLLRRKEPLHGTPRIILSTIHGAKGGEADNVIVFTEISRAAELTMRFHPDDLHRLFYVAITRSKNNLYLIEAANALNRYPL